MKDVFAALLSGYLIILWLSRIFSLFFWYSILTKQDENLIWLISDERVSVVDNSMEYQQWCPVEYLCIASQLQCSCGALTKFLSLAFTFVRGNSESK